ncbi:MAG: DUF167 domain-containing protein [Bdellovibrionota bacterium]
MSAYLTNHAEGALLRVHAQPKASRSAVVGIHGDALKIAVQAPPVDSAANEAIRELLAELLRLPKSRVTLKSGEKSRRKTFLLAGLTAAAAQTLLGAP